MKDLVYMPRMFGDLYYPGGFPLNPQTSWWSGNVKDDLVLAIKHYYNYFTDEEPHPTKEQKQMLIEFLIYFINAPVWAMNPHDNGTLKRLRRRAEHIKTLEDAHNFVHECMDAGLDPL